MTLASKFKIPFSNVFLSIWIFGEILSFWNTVYLKIGFKTSKDVNANSDFCANLKIFQAHKMSNVHPAQRYLKVACPWSYFYFAQEHHEHFFAKNFLFCCRNSGNLVAQLRHVLLLPLPGFQMLQPLLLFEHRTAYIFHPQEVEKWLKMYNCFIVPQIKCSTGRTFWL